LATTEFSAFGERPSVFALASHDLRGPVSALKLLIAAANQELQSVSDKHAQKKLSMLLHRMMRQTEELAWLAGCLANLAFLERDSLEVPVEGADLVELTSTAVVRLAEAARLAECKVALHSPGTVSGRWRRALLEDAVAHIVRNSLKSGSGKSIAITVGCDETNAWLSVENHGLKPSGIHNHRSEILDQDLVLRTAGEIAEALGASIDIDRRSGESSTITLRLPRAQANQTI
jgi:signal transduction histidine kinase